MMAAAVAGHEFRWGSRTYVMGIVNTSPDSFSGDGLAEAEAAVDQGLGMVRDGANLLDVGGQSTRPGHEPITAAEEIARTQRVVERLATSAGVPVSIDTYKLEVAEAAVQAGASIINDVWALQRSPGMADLAARCGCALVVMHNQDGTDYAGDLMDEIKRVLREATRLAVDAGVPRARVWIDPGIGFGKTADHNWEVLRRLPELKELGQPMVVGTSRKSFIGRLLDLPASERGEGTAATVAASVMLGADIVRVHDVLAMTRVARVADRIART